MIILIVPLMEMHIKKKMEFLPKFIKIKIFSFFEFKEILNFRLVCKDFVRTVSDGKWINKPVKPHFKNIRNIFKVFQFPNIDLSIKTSYSIKNNKIHFLREIDDQYKVLHSAFNRHNLDNVSDSSDFFDEIVSVVSHCHTLNFSNTILNDVHLELLSECYSLNLCNTNVTDEGVKKLTKCTILKLANTSVTDDSVKLLGNCKELYIAKTKITNNCLPFLSKCKIIDLSDTAVNDTNLMFLNECHTVKLNRCDVGPGIKYLTKCSELNLSNTNVTDDCFVSPFKCHTLSLSCTSITANSFQFLANCRELDICFTNIKDDGLVFLKNCEFVNLFGCRKVTRDCEKILRHCKHIILPSGKDMIEGKKYSFKFK